MSRLEEFRRAKDAFFATDPGSPLDPEQRQSFSGLAYYPEAPSLVITAAPEEPDDDVPFAVPTSTGDAQVYRRAGVVRFTVDGEPAQLTLLQRDGAPGHGLFLPFRDETNRDETYPAGRYLEVHPATDGTVTVDFNYAYNPFCAYNDAWSCPLPPPENWLAVRIEAGEKRFPTPR